ncbi:MAG: sulfatase [Planctomycetes bacterium]|nr:sulfatase [Planctomycetota bacterium]
MRRLHLATLCLLLLPLAACDDARDDAPATTGAGTLAGKPNLVLVTVDTLRADHLHCYGHWRETSPNVDALADEGVLFERAYSVMGTTLPSHLSILTGLYPHQHGYLANHGAMGGGFTSSAGRHTLAEALAAEGYTTAAFVSGPTVSKATGLDAGFQVFDEHHHPAPKTLEDTSRRSEDTTAAALAWLAQAPREPFFLWIHYWDPHEPNLPREPFASAFRTDERLEALIDERVIRPEVLAERFPPRELARLFAPELAPALDAGEDATLPPIDRDAVRRLLNLYDGDVLATDHAFGQVVAALKARGLYERTVVVFTADHGQALGQHDWLEHGRIQGEDVHVPLVMRFPAGVLDGPRRVLDVVSSVDLLPTLLARLPQLAVSDLRAQLSGEDALGPGDLRNSAFSQRSARDRDWEPGEDTDGPKFALTTRDWKYYFRPEGTDELYDLRVDPGELHDVADAHADVVEALRRRVLHVLDERRYTPEAGAEDTPEARAYREMLDKLGYTGGAERH